MPMPSIRRLVNAGPRALPARMLLGSLPAMLFGCAGARLAVNEPSPASTPKASTLRAGTAQVDITPPPGAPLFGYSWDAAAKARGVWTRLKARVIALQGSDGERLALVQTDLGATSALVHRRVAAITAPVDGVTADRLLIAATHTHAGPGGYFGEKFFNVFGSGRPGYDPAIVDALVMQMSAAIHRAFAELEPAAIGAAEITVANVSHNRSRDARIGDFTSVGSTPADIDPTLRLLRIDRTLGAQSQPMAALFFFAVHGTSLPQGNQLYHGDLHAVAERALANRIGVMRPGPKPILSAFMNGAEGDVSPSYQSQGRDEAIRLGEAIAEQATLAFDSLDGKLDPNPQLLHAYREIELPGLKTASGALCQDAEIGVATMGGAEDGRSPLYGRLGVYEGHRRKMPSGCQSYKIPAAGFLQDWILVQEQDPLASTWQVLSGGGEPALFPRIAPFQVIALGNSMLLATIPGEPTTEVGRRVRESVKSAWSSSRATNPVPITAVVGLANDYFYYFTTTAEFEAQHYEGGSTLYGPLQSAAAEEQLVAATRALGTANAQLYAKNREFSPGPESQLVARCSCPTDSWRVLETEVDLPSEAGQSRRISVKFQGPKEQSNCGRFPSARILCQGIPLVGPDGAAENDEGYRFQIQRLDGDTWLARWMVHKNMPKVSGCSMEIAREGQPNLLSKAFDL